MSKLFNTLLVTNVLKYYADRGLADEFMIYFSKRTREMRGTYGGGLYGQCVFKNYIKNRDGFNPRIKKECPIYKK